MADKAAQLRAKLKNIRAAQENAASSKAAAPKPDAVVSKAAVPKPHAAISKAAKPPPVAAASKAATPSSDAAASKAASGFKVRGAPRLVDSDDEVIDLDAEAEQKKSRRPTPNKPPPAKSQAGAPPAKSQAGVLPPAPARDKSAEVAAKAAVAAKVAVAANVAAVMGEESSPALARAMSRLGPMPLPPGARLATPAGPSVVRSHSSLVVEPSVPVGAEEAKDSHRVLTCGFLPHWEEEDLFRALEKHRIGSVVDARPAAAQATIAKVRQACASKGMTYDWQPMLSSAQSAAQTAAKAAVLMRLAAQGRGVATGGRKPCILFSGGSWRLCPARRDIAKELEKKGIDVFHISYCGQYLERHKEVSSAEEGKLEVETPQPATASGTSASSRSTASNMKTMPVAQPSLVRGPELLVPAADKVPEVAELQTVVIPPKDDKHRGTLIYLHPFKGSPLRYLDEAQIFAQNGVRLVFPSAPQLPITVLGGKQEASWYDYTSDNRGHSEDDVNELTLNVVRARLASLIEKEAALLGVGGHARLMIGGAAQGCAAALHAMLCHSTPLAAFVGICGHALWCTPPKGNSRQSLQFFACQGDNVIQWSWAQKTVERLQVHHKVTVYGPFLGLGHILDVDPTAEADWMRIACGRGLSLSGSFEPKQNYRKHALKQQAAPGLGDSAPPSKAPSLLGIAPALLGVRAANAQSAGIPASLTTGASSLEPNALAANGAVPKMSPPQSAPKLIPAAPLPSPSADDSDDEMDSFDPFAEPEIDVAEVNAAARKAEKEANESDTAALAADAVLARLQAENSREVEALLHIDLLFVAPRSKGAGAPPGQTAKATPRFLPTTPTPSLGQGFNPPGPKSFAAAPKGPPLPRGTLLRTQPKTVTSFEFLLPYSSGWLEEFERVLQASASGVGLSEQDFDPMVLVVRDAQGKLLDPEGDEPARSQFPLRAVYTGDAAWKGISPAMKAAPKFNAPPKLSGVHLISQFPKVGLDFGIVDVDAVPAKRVSAWDFLSGPILVPSPDVDASPIDDLDIAVVDDIDEAGEHLAKRQKLEV